MRAWCSSAVVLVAGFAAYLPAAAQPIRMPDEQPFRAGLSQSDQSQNYQPFASQQPGEMRLSERPIGEVIATKLGIANGSAEFFSYHVENAPSNRTMLDGVVDGGGIKLKLTW